MNKERIEQKPADQVSDSHNLIATVLCLQHFDSFKSIASNEYTQIKHQNHIKKIKNTKGVSFVSGVRRQ